MSKPKQLNQLQIAFLQPHNLKRLRSLFTIKGLAKRYGISEQIIRKRLKEINEET